MQVVLALAGVVVAAAAVYFAADQARTNRIRLQHELFERRFEVFKEVQAYLTFILQEGGLKMGPEGGKRIGAMITALQKCRFLFGSEISDYADSIYSRSLRVAIYDGKLSHPDAADGELKWLLEQSTEMFRIFAQYLKLDAVAGKTSIWAKVLKRLRRGGLAAPRPIAKTN